MQSQQAKPEAAAVVEKKMNETRVSAVIQVSNHHESCDFALTTVLENPDKFLDVHIIESGYDDKRYAKQKKTLEEKHNIPLFFHNSFNYDDCKSMHGVLFIPPNVHTNGGVLEQKIVEDPKNYPGSNFFCTQSVLAPASGFFSIGFLLVLLCFDMMRAFWGWLGRFHRTNDLRFVLFNSRGVKRFLPEESTRLVLWFVSRVAPSAYAGDSCLEIIPEEECGMQLLARTLQNHRYLRILRIRWWILSFLMYFFFTLPWWNVFYSPGSDSWFYRPIWPGEGGAWYFWFCLLVFETIYAIYVSSKYMLLPSKLIYFPLIPLCFVLFVTVSPLVFFVVRFFFAPEKRATVPKASQPQPSQ
jgi:hypothetical protein